MVVPHFEDFFLPSLKFFKDGNIHTKKELSEYNAKYFNLDESELKETTREGTLPRYKDRSAWAVNYLYNAGLLKKSKRGKYQITSEGIKILNENIEINMSLLETYPAFRDYKYPNKKREITTKNQIEDTEPTEKNLSPIDRLEEAHNEINEELSNTLLDEIMNNSPEFFERLVVDLLINMGYGGSRKEAGKAVGKVGDGGVDGVIKEDHLGLDNIYIQAKRYKKDSNISAETLRSFTGALDTKKSNKGVFITTSDFTSGAINHVKQTSKHIALINGEKLTSLMIKFNVGVSPKEVYEIKEIDSDYFEN